MGSVAMETVVREALAWAIVFSDSRRMGTGLARRFCTATVWAKVSSKQPAVAMTLAAMLVVAMACAAMLVVARVPMLDCSPCTPNAFGPHGLPDKIWLR